MPHDVPLWRRMAAETIGTGLLVAVVVGSGIAASRLTDDAALQLLINALTTALGLGAIIAMLMPVSGAHLNPAVSLADWTIARRRGSAPPLLHLGGYVAAQTTGAVLGAVLANAMYGVTQGTSPTVRGGGPLLLSEVTATAGLVLLIFLLATSGRTASVPIAVGAWIGAAYWWTSSTSFANPAATVGRIFSDSFAGISPVSVPPFVAAQLVGGAVGLALLAILRPPRQESR